MTIPLPPSMAALPRDKHGRPIPWFVHVADGVPDFRVIRLNGIRDAYKFQWCWTCGQPRGAFAAFVIGPMCAINRVTSEPPSHRACAEYSAQACPFLSTPTMKRRERGLENQPYAGGGVHIDRNPGAAVVWVTRTFKPIRAGNGELFRLGEPTHVGCYAHGREATAAEVWQSIDAGLPALREAAALDGPAGLAEFEQQLAAVERYLPPRPPHVSVPVDPADWNVPGVPVGRLAQSLAVLSQSFALHPDQGTVMVRYDHAGNRHTAPEGTRKCVRVIGRPHPTDLVHGLFAADQLGADRVIQLMTRCGQRAAQFVPESEGKDITCPACRRSS